MQTGELIALEGGEGVGKTTVFTELQRIAQGNKKFLFFREPGGTEAGEMVRTVLKSPDHDLDSLTQFLLFMASRVELFEKKVRPALAAGINVVTDRFDASTFVYQIFEPERHDLETFFNTIRLRYTRPLQIGCDWLKPVYVYFDLDAELGTVRIKKEGRDLDVNDQKPLDFHQKIKEGYKVFFMNRPHVTIDASKAKAEVLSSVLSIIKAKTGIDLGLAPALF